MALLNRVPCWPPTPDLSVSICPVLWSEVWNTPRVNLTLITQSLSQQCFLGPHHVKLWKAITQPRLTLNLSFPFSSKCQGYGCGPTPGFKLACNIAVSRKRSRKCKGNQRRSHLTSSKGLNSPRTEIWDTSQHDTDCLLEGTFWKVTGDLERWLDMALIHASG